MKKVIQVIGMIFTIVLIGCAKKTELITPEVSAKVIEVDSCTTIPDNKIIDIITEDTTGESIIEPEPFAVEEIFTILPFLLFIIFFTIN